MKQVWKWGLITLLGLVTIMGLFVAALFGFSLYRLNRSYEVQVAPVEIPSGAEARARGDHIALIYGCKRCHGVDLAGNIEARDPALGLIANANLTRGMGSDISNYRTEDWVRAIRHGIGPDGKPLLLMPSQQFATMSDEDLGALLAYLQSLPPVDKTLPDLKLKPVSQLRYALGQIDFLVPAEQINHRAVGLPAPEPGATAAYGAYLARFCSFCHGSDFSGGPIPGALPTDPPAPNLTPAGSLQGWRFEEFLAAMRFGITPSGHQLRDEFMPYQAMYGQMTVDEWQAIWLYLQSLPPKRIAASE